jgi:N-sulfoglucosamine sulfohydrolase
MFTPPFRLAGRWHLQTIACGWLVLLAAATWAAEPGPQRPETQRPETQRPNILLAISDDQSFAHTSAAGYPAISTPAFDRVARSGLYVAHAITASPGCSPSRAALLTGRYPWQLEHAGTHASSFPATYAVYPDLLEQAGYHVGYTGKPWGPGNWKVSEWQRNPAGTAYTKFRDDDAPPGMSKSDYARNFAAFLEDRQEDQPFCFWYGGSEPHRGFAKGLGLKQGKQLAAAQVPPFLPDTPEIRSDLLDYCVEIEHFDSHLARMLDLLESRGELENTLVVVTSDNGMAFPAAKANCYEYGIHMPMAISWPQRLQQGRTIDQLISLVDLAPTFLAAAGLEKHEQMVGRNLLPILSGEQVSATEAVAEAVYSARERHSSSRWNNLAYPQRAIRTREYLLIRNFRPDRWPAGAPRKLNGDVLGPPHGGYHDIDACPTFSYMIEHREEPAVARLFHNAVDKRPAWELFHLDSDPGCLHNLADVAEHQPIRQRLQAQLEDYLRQTADPRILDGGDVFETYQRYSPIRQFPHPDDE